jgi:hypothetical protein
MKKEIEHNLLTLSKNGPKDLWPSISNYVLQLSSSDDQESPVLFMYFLDSGGGSYPEVISNAQAEWFQHVSEEINPDSRYQSCVNISELDSWGYGLPFLAWPVAKQRRISRGRPERSHKCPTS